MECEGEPGRGPARPVVPNSEARCQPVFVDGPLKGTADHVITAAARRGGLCVTAGIDIGTVQVDQVWYRFGEVDMFGHVILVGSVAWPPSPRDLFRELTSAAAKSACVAYRYPEAFAAPAGPPS